MGNVNSDCDNNVNLFDVNDGDDKTNGDKSDFILYDALNNKIDEELFDNSNIPTDITDNPKRERYENTMKILTLLNEFYHLGKKDICLEKVLSRDYMINYVQRLLISNELVEWIQTNMPNKLITILDLPYFMHDVEKVFEKDTTHYYPCVNELLEIYKTNLFPKLTDKDKKNLQSKAKLYKIIPVEDYAKVCKIDNLTEDVLDSIIIKQKKVGNKIFSFFELTKEQKQKYIKDSLLNLSLENINQKAIVDIVYSDFDKVIEYYNLDNFIKLNISIENMLLNLTVLTYNYKSNIEAKTNKIKKTHLEKYYRNVYVHTQPESNKKYRYYLNFEDHWNLYNQNETKYLEILMNNCISDDYTFNDYKHTDYSFLNSFNENVKQNLITKINSDTNRVIENRYGIVNCLEDFLDICVFIHMPPNFLKLDGIEYSDDSNAILLATLNTIGYDMGKFKYLKYNLRQTIELVESC